MPYRQRDLLLVPIPFSDLTSRKMRPVVVLSNDGYSRAGPDVLVAGVTSNLEQRQYTVPLDTAQLEEGAMRRPSVVRVDKLFSIDQGIVRAYFGRVQGDTFGRILQELQALVAQSG
jgi:mRNA interferase MazF